MRGKANISYTDSRGNVFDLMIDSFRRITTANFHNYSWQKESTETRFGEKLRAWKKAAAQYDVTIYFDGDKKEKHLNDFHDALEYDIVYNQPGTLTWEDYSIECYGISSKTYPAADAVNSPTANDVTFYCPSPWWTKTSLITSYDIGNIDDIDVLYVSDTEFTDLEGHPIVPVTGRVYKVASGTHVGQRYLWDGERYIDLLPSYSKTYEPAYDYAFDYIVDYDSYLSLYNDNILGSSFIAVIYGPTDSPYITLTNGVDEDVHISINTDVPSGAKLVVDSTNKTVLKYMPDGTVINAFGARNLDAGYLWNRVPYGQSRVIWDGSFKFDMYLVEERSEPKWLSD